MSLSSEQKSLEHARAAHLFPSEIDTLYWAARGKTADETALITQLSRHTITTYRQQAIAKLGASNITHAVWLAEQLGLIATHNSLKT